MENKTKMISGDPLKMLNKVIDPKRKADALKLFNIIGKVIKDQPSIWGDSMIGYGLYKYKYASGRAGEWFKMGFSPRKRSLVLYLMDGTTMHKKRLDKMGLTDTGKSCVYIKELDQIDENDLISLIKESYANVSNDIIVY